VEFFSFVLIYTDPLNPCFSRYFFFSAPSVTLPITLREGLVFFLIPSSVPHAFNKARPPSCLSSVILPHFFCPAKHGSVEAVSYFKNILRLFVIYTLFFPSSSFLSRPTKFELDEFAAFDFSQMVPPCL